MLNFGLLLLLFLIVIFLKTYCALKEEELKACSIISLLLVFEIYEKKMQEKEPLHLNKFKYSGYARFIHFDT